MNKEAKILYVDDEPINLQLFKIQLGKKYNIITAESGPKALDMLNNNRDVCAVISDMNMPKMNGLEFIHLAKDRFPSIEFFILTGYEITLEIQDALDTGLIIKYLKKPFNIPEIDLSLAKVIKV